MSRPLARVRLRLLAEAEAVDEAQRVLSCDEDEARSWLTRRGLLNDRPSRPGRAVVSLEEFELALLTETEPGPGSGKRPDPDAMAAYVEGRPAPARSSPEELRLRRSSAARERIAMGLGAVLSLDHAAKILPMDAVAARRWLLAEGLVHQLSGRSVVRWFDVWERLADSGPDELANNNVVLLPRFEREKL